MVFHNKPEHLKLYAPFLPDIEQPETEWNQAPLVCVKFAQSWVPMILGALEALRWADLYAGDPDRAEKIASQVLDLQLAIMTGNCSDTEVEMYLLRQNAINPCLLEQSVDNGLTWTSAFDFGACLQVAIGQDYSENALAIAQVNVFTHNATEQYDGTLGSVAPDLVHDETPYDDYRRTAICLMVHNIVTLVAAAALAHRNSQSGLIQDFNRWMANAKLWVIDAYLWLADYGLDMPIIPDVQLVEILRNLQAGTVDWLEKDDTAAFEDAALLESILCHAIQFFGGAQVTQSMFENMFNGVITVQGVTEDMEDWLKNAVLGDDMYAANMKLLNELPAKLESGEIVYQCPCDEWEADVFLLLEENTDFLGNGAVTGGTWIDPAWSYLDGKIDPQSGYYYRTLALKLTFPEALITRIEVTDYTLLAFDFSDSTIYCDEYPTDNPFLWVHEWTGYHGGHSTPSFAHYTSQINWVVKCDRDLSLAQLKGDIKGYGMRVFGRGFNPFA